MRTSQANKIINYLEQGGSLSQIEALRLFGCGRLAARISDIKKRGYSIRTATEVYRGDDGEYKSYARYSFDDDNPFIQEE